MDAQSVSSILNPPVAEAAQKSSDILGKDDFLKLLTSQLKYQNPLEPMNDEQFVAQMTQFSSLEQLQNMNSTLSQNAQWNMLLSQTINNTMATSLIGKEVTADTTAIGLNDSDGTDISFKSADYAQSGTVTISDENGKVVRSIHVENLPTGSNIVHWDGKDDAGDAAPTGNYTYQVELKDTNGQAVSVSNFRSGLVESVKYVDGQAYLLVDGSYIPLANVREVKSGG